MIIRNLTEIIDSERDVFWGNGQSRRFLTKADGVGYTITDTIVNAGTSSLLEYKNHLESCYCIEGEGEVEGVESGEVHEIRTGVMYVLNNKDKHFLRARTTMRLICVFVPALEGHECHDLSELRSSCY